jgi:methionyl-tRNA formyltransferase
MGTPEFSVPCLQRIAAGRHTIAAVVTKPDTPAGRGRILTAPPIKEAASHLGIPVLQPVSLRDDAAIAQIRALNPDIVVVVAFRILPPEILAIPRLGSANLHGSLLPKYRGAAPIQRALINGERESGVTVFLLEPTIDTGMILRRHAVEIGENETYGDLATRLAAIGAEELAAAIDEIAAGTARAIRQDDAEATLAPKLTKEDGRIDWNAASVAIRNRVRGVTPSPGAFTLWRGHQLGVHRVSSELDSVWRGTPGTLLAADPKRGALVATGDGAVWLETVQPPGKRPMEGAVWVRGARLELAEQFG